MWSAILDFIGTILGIFTDIWHWKEVKKRRKFEEENNLPKKIILHPVTKILIILFVIVVPLKIIFFSIFLKNKKTQKTKEKIAKIQEILNAEKNQLGVYPTSLDKIIRNNPLRKNLTKDAWNNNFVYVASSDLLTYKLISLGKDHLLNTKDDISISK